ncbi:uncharacterized protein HD556DRAFT_729336 [Suillus plorans]|uniref:Uncharacterized protein n=1 Tax=Suillus plorans TaxID=116603 RepID=A0A9P7DF83_9AGAM|nr:uncharacterized protein HD556DRAFT_729336 [Suillus plorans]KAG1790447.1 hypothetical protein HD556DRAFT_729336 [Suillus plorans]
MIRTYMACSGSQDAHKIAKSAFYSKFDATRKAKDVPPRGKNMQDLSGGTSHGVTTRIQPARPTSRHNLFASLVHLLGPPMPWWQLLIQAQVTQLPANIILGEFRWKISLISLVLKIGLGSFYQMAASEAWIELYELLNLDAKGIDDNFRGRMKVWMRKTMRLGCDYVMFVVGQFKIIYRSGRSHGDHSLTSANFRTGRTLLPNGWRISKHQHCRDTAAVHEVNGTPRQIVTILLRTNNNLKWNYLRYMSQRQSKCIILIELTFVFVSQ